MLKVKIRSNAVAATIAKTYRKYGYDCRLTPNSGANAAFPGDLKSSIDLSEVKSERKFDSKLNKVIEIRHKDVAQIMREAKQEGLPFALHFKPFNSRNVWTLFQWVERDSASIPFATREYVKTTPIGNIRCLEKDLDATKVYLADIAPESEDPKLHFFCELNVYLGLKEMHEGRVERYIRTTTHYMN